MYRYDALDDLVKVCQNGTLDGAGNCLGSHVQTRNFQYDGLRQLTQATNPENGTVSYVYDNSGNLWTRTQAGVTKTLAYDGLNRLTGFSYSAGATPTVTLSYDQDMAIPGHVEANFFQGRLVMASAATTSGTVSQTVYRYDALGRVQSSWQVPQGQGAGYVFARAESASVQCVQIAKLGRACEYRGRHEGYAIIWKRRATQLQRHSSALRHVPRRRTGNGTPSAAPRTPLHRKGTAPRHSPCTDEQPSPSVPS